MVTTPKKTQITILKQTVDEHSHSAYNRLMLRKPVEIYRTNSTNYPNYELIVLEANWEKATLFTNNLLEDGRKVLSTELSLYRNEPNNQIYFRTIADIGQTEHQYRFDLNSEDKKEVLGGGSGNGMPVFIKVANIVIERLTENLNLSLCGHDVWSTLDQSLSILNFISTKIQIEKYSKGVKI